MHDRSTPWVCRAWPWLAAALALGASGLAAQPRLLQHGEGLDAAIMDGETIQAPSSLPPRHPGPKSGRESPAAWLLDDEAAQRPASPDVEREVHQRLQWLQAQADAAETGRSTPAQAAQAALELGLIHLHGSGVAIDPAQAQRWFEQALELQPQGRAVAGLAWCHLQGCQLPPNDDAARTMIARLRSAHPGKAAFLEWALALQQAPLVVAASRAPVDGAASHRLQLPQPELLRQSAQAGEVHAHVELGIDAYNQGQESRARGHFRAAAHGSPAARANLELLDAAARQQRQAVQQEGAAALQAAYRAHRGAEVPANYTEAMRLYRLAAQQGNASARQMLELILSRPLQDGSINVMWMRELALLDLSGALPQLAISGRPLQLQRDPTPLFDWLPAYWQERATLRGLMAPL